MPWARFDDRRHQNAKLRRAGLEASALDSYAITYCSSELTDGFVPSEVVAMLAGVRHWKKLARALVEVGRWTEVDGGYSVVNYLVYNPSREQVEADRKMKRQRAEAGASARWSKQASGNAPGMLRASAGQTGSNAPGMLTSTVGEDAPTPLPIPKKSQRLLSSLPSSVAPVREALR